MATEALLVPGAGTEGAQTSSLLLLKTYFGKGQKLPASFVDGVTHEADEPRATLPSEQAEQIAAEASPGVVIVAQSMGALGVMRALRDPEVDAQVAGAIFIAPPARRPYADVMLHTVILDRCGETRPPDGILRGGVSIKTYSHPDGVTFTEEYIEEVREHEDDFDEELRSLAAEGIVKIVCPSRDWNDNYNIDTYPNSMAVEGTHSLAGGGDGELILACRKIWQVINVITDAGTGADDARLQSA